MKVVYKSAIKLAVESSVPGPHQVGQVVLYYDYAIPLAVVRFGLYNGAINLGRFQPEDKELVAIRFDAAHDMLGFAANKFEAWEDATDHEAIRKAVTLQIKLEAARAGLLRRATQDEISDFYS